MYERLSRFSTFSTSLHSNARPIHKRRDLLNRASNETTPLHETENPASVNTVKNSCECGQLPPREERYRKVLEGVLLSRKWDFPSLPFLILGTEESYLQILGPIESLAESCVRATEELGDTTSALRRRNNAFFRKTISLLSHIKAVTNMWNETLSIKLLTKQVLVLGRSRSFAQESPAVPFLVQRRHTTSFTCTNETHLSNNES